MRSKERGIALLLALLIVAIFLALLGQMAVTTRSTRSISENYLGDLQNSYGARAGYYQARLYLKADSEKAPKVDSLGEKWAKDIQFPLGVSEVSVHVEDSERRINLSLINSDDGKVNAAIVTRFRRLVEVLGHPPEIADRIVDYIDADTQGSYEIGARNERLHNLEELLRIDGVTRETLYGGRVSGNQVKGILEFLTLWPKTEKDGGTGKINVNTAPLEVLMALSSKLDASLAAEIVNYRSVQKADGTFQVFESAADLKNVSGMTDAVLNEISASVAVIGSHFEIRVQSLRKRGGVKKSWLYVVKRTTGENAEIALVYSQRESDFLAVQPEDEE